MSGGDRHFCSTCQQAEDRSLGHEPKTWGHQGTVRKSESVSTAYRGGGLLCRSKQQQQHPSPEAQVSTTRMRGIGLGLGGLDIRTLGKKE